MPSYVTPKKGVEYIFYISLRSQANTKVMQSNPTIAAGDFKVSIDGGALANPATLPAVTPASSKMVKVTLSTSEMNGDNITLVCSDASGSEWCDLTVNIQTSARQIDDLSFPTVSGRSTDVTATGAVGVDWGNVENPTTTVNLSGTTVKDATDVETKLGTPNFGDVSQDIAAVQTAVDTTYADLGTVIARIGTPSNLGTGASLATNMVDLGNDLRGLIGRGILPVGSTGNDTTHVHLDGLTQGDDEINDLLLVIYDTSNDEYHARWIDDWVLATELATVATLPFTPVNTDLFWLTSLRRDVAGGSAPSAADVADAVWDEARAGHVGAGSFGEGVKVESLNTQAQSDVEAVVDALIQSYWLTGQLAPTDHLLATTIDTLATQVSFTLTAGTLDDNAYNECLIVVTDSASLVKRCFGYIEDYEVTAGPVRTVTLRADPGIFTMAVGDRVDIFAKTSADVASIVTAVAQKIADIVLRRKQANVEASANGDAIDDAGSLFGFVQQARQSNTVDNPGFLTVYETDGTTELEQIPLTTDPVAEPITGAG